MTLDFDKIDKIIHERGRLAIMTLLATRVRWSFADLKNELKLSDGNLVTHLRTLHHAGLRRRDQGGSSIVPQTSYALTATRAQSVSRLPHDYWNKIVKAGQG